MKGRIHSEDDSEKNESSEDSLCEIPFKLYPHRDSNGDHGEGNSPSKSSCGCAANIALFLAMAGAEACTIPYPMTQIAMKEPIAVKSQPRWALRKTGRATTNQMSREAKRKNRAKDRMLISRDFEKSSLNFAFCFDRPKSP